MQNILPPYQPLARYVVEPMKDDDIWYSAVSEFDKKNYKRAAMQTLRYINPELLEGQLLNDRVEIQKSHGDVVIKIEIDEHRLKAEVDALGIDEKSNKIAILRKAAELNFSYVEYIQYSYEKNTFCMRYEEELSRMHPFKIYSVLTEMVFCTDYYKQLFIKEYGAKELEASQKQELEPELKSRVIKEIKQIVTKEYNKYKRYVEQNLHSNFRWDIALITLYKLANMPYIQSRIKANLSSKIRMLNNNDIDFEKRTQDAHEYIVSLQKMDEQEISESIYFQEYFVAYRSTPSRNMIVQEKLDEDKAVVEKYVAQKSYTALSYFLYGRFLRMMYEYNFNKAQHEKIEDALAEATKCNEIQDSSEILSNLFYDMYEDEWYDDVHVQSKKTEKNPFRYLKYLRYLING